MCNLNQIFRGLFQACYLGYKIDHAYEGKGVMFEALQETIRFAFEDFKLHRIMANYMPTNIRSANLLNRLGFEIEGYAKNYLLINNKWEDHTLTSLSYEQWQILQKNSVNFIPSNERQLESYLQQHIPISKAIGIKVLHASADKVILAAPFSNNINHKKTIFGGSLHAVATLACWSLLHLNLKNKNLKNQIVITQSETSYHLPVDADFKVIWKWNEAGLWEAIDDRLIKRKIHELMENRKITKGSVNSVLDIIKTEIFMANHQFDVDIRGINCLNGELHFREYNWHLETHDRENYRTTQIPILYNPQATAPRFEEFLDGIFEGDKDADEKRLLYANF